MIANELGVPIKATAGPVIERAGDLAALLTALEHREILFVDEIHRLDAKVEEILYPALEDYSLDLMIGSGPGARSMKIPLKPFTLVGATTRAGLLTAPAAGPLRHRPPPRLLHRGRPPLIVTRSARILGVPIDADGRRGDRGPQPGHARGSPTACSAACATSPRSGRGARSPPPSPATPSPSSRSTRTASTRWTGGCSSPSSRSSAAGRSGVNALAAAISEEPDAIEDIYEPYLLQHGFLDRTPRGRTATRRAYEHLGLPVPDSAPPNGPQKKLF